MKLQNYQDKLQKLSQEIQYIEQQRSQLIEQVLKVQGAIEALQQHKCETTEQTTEE